MELLVGMAQVRGWNRYRIPKWGGRGRYFGGKHKGPSWERTMGEGGAGTSGGFEGEFRCASVTYKLSRGASDGELGSLSACRK